MIVDILQHTPVWVFAVFGLLVVLGTRLVRPNRVGIARLAIVPVAMATWSFYAMVQAFGASSSAPVAWIAVVAAAIAVGLRMAPRHDVQYSAGDRTFEVPGSFAPLALMMTIFFTRYALAVGLVLHPAWSSDATFACAVGALSGCVSGTFVLRALRISRVAVSTRVADARLSA